MAHVLEREGIDGIAGRGIEPAGAARQVTPRDFGEYDLILAMDAEKASLRSGPSPAPGAQHAELLTIASGGDLDVPDPYFGGDDGFDNVLELVTRACEGLLEEVRAGGR